ncbi:hypothetical protein KUTeg_025072 [Tegillarca granosa]|uniref:Uncharacterized protein n=1 Tax=Tegillarca granosa TaxID=220873 RepID=A0ABQ9E466_TEGGR|nr:hypothetical protein KUTeg_025072 [Tegillarca granosa]
MNVYNYNCIDFYILMEVRNMICFQIKIEKKNQINENLPRKKMIILIEKLKCEGIINDKPWEKLY